jgi:hypothetical protein
VLVAADFSASHAMKRGEPRATCQRGIRRDRPIALILVAGIAVAGDAPRELVDEVLPFTPRQRLLFLAIGFEGGVVEESLWRRRRRRRLR